MHYTANPRCAVKHHLRYNSAAVHASAPHTVMYNTYTTSQGSSEFPRGCSQRLTHREFSRFVAGTKFPTKAGRATVAHGHVLATCLKCIHQYKTMPWAFNDINETRGNHRVTPPEYNTSGIHKQKPLNNKDSKCPETYTRHFKTYTRQRAKIRVGYGEDNKRKFRQW
jgi:hypothetical protein